MSFVKRVKLEHGKWAMVDRPGVIMDVDKQELSVDEAYQRAPAQRKVEEMAKRWSWIACGVIIVADRGKIFHVIDGQHRVLAAMRRDDVTTLPCLVFPTESIEQEAQGFLDSNTTQRRLTGFDRYGALLITKDPAALLVQKLCAATGREVSKWQSPRTVRCVATMLRFAGNQPAVFTRVWPLVHELHHGISVSDRVLCGLVYIESHLPEGQSLSQPRWKARILRLGYNEISDGIAKATAYYRRGGERIWARGVLDTINRGLQHRLVLASGEDESEASQT
jgi:Family of unknown function (DUF6551)